MSARSRIQNDILFVRMRRDRYVFARPINARICSYNNVLTLMQLRAAIPLCFCTYHLME